jgi:hypothetical protein
MCWDCYANPGGDPYKNFKRGGVEVEDFDDEVKYRHPKRRTKKGRPRSATRNPCPQSEDGKHVWVWVGYESMYSDTDKIFYKHFGFHRKEIKTCCGCMATSGFGRESERYMKIKERKWRKITGGEYAIKRGEPVPRWGRWSGFYNFSWESYDEAYMEKVREAEAKRREERAKYNSYMDYLAARRKALGL